MATAPAAPAAPPAWEMDHAVPLQEKGILGRGYEWYPVIGLSLTAAITQEWWIADEYWVISSSVFPVLYSFWLFGSDRFDARQKKLWDTQLSNLRNGWGFRMDMLQAHKNLESFALSHAADLRSLFDEEKQVNIKAVDYVNLQARADAHAMVNARLKIIANLESDTRGRAVNALSSKAAEFVTKKYRESPAAVKQRAVDAAINNITSDISSTWVYKTTTAWRSVDAAVAPLQANDPVKLLFDEFLAHRHTPQQLGIPDSVQRLFQREAAEAAKARAAAPAPAAGGSGGGH